MRNITPHEIGTTETLGEFIVWGKDETGQDYRTYVNVFDQITPVTDENIKNLAIDNDAWVKFPNEKIDPKPYQPKTGVKCGCRRGVERDNCPNCEGTGMVIDFRAIHARRDNA